ncbi:MAG: hypothetical protein RLZZ359_1063 [Actinomycetota bacterium]|jgi:Tfp pilus assembly protein PilZ
MTDYADPPRPILSYSSLIGHFNKTALAAIGELQFLAHRLANHPDVGPGSFRNRAGQINALSVLLKYQGRANRYRAMQWPEFRRVAEPATLDPADSLSFERETLAVLEKLKHDLEETREIPLTRVSTCLIAICKSPVMNIRQLSDMATISESTAKRWLMRLQKMGIMHVQNHRGQNQYIVIELVDLIDKYAKTRRFAWVEPANNERIKGAKVGWKMKN